MIRGWLILGRGDGEVQDMDLFGRRCGSLMERGLPLVVISRPRLFFGCC